MSSAKPTGAIAAFELVTEVEGLQTGMMVATHKLPNGALTSSVFFNATNFLIGRKGVSNSYQTSFLVKTERVGTTSPPVYATKVVVNGDFFALKSIFAKHIAVGTLDVITSNVGTLTLGKLQSKDGLVLFDLTLKKFVLSRP
jgi:hypothetical protein